MKKMFLLIITLATANAATQSLEVKQSNKQTVIEIYAQHDGFINIDKQPGNCGIVYLLDSKNQLIASSPVNFGAINKPIKQGKHTIQIIPNRFDCVLNIVY